MSALLGIIFSQLWTGYRSERGNFIGYGKKDSFFLCVSTLCSSAMLRTGGRDNRLVLWNSQSAGEEKERAVHSLLSCFFVLRGSQGCDEWTILEIWKMSRRSEMEEEISRQTKPQHVWRPWLKSLVRRFLGSELLYSWRLVSS